MINWLRQILLALDQLGNAVLGGWADETISSRAWRTSPRLATFIDAVFWFDPDHCFESYVSEQLRSQFPPELRDAQ